ncbi:MAG: hypothetical protein IPP19_03095 [Verrucomicrobia bacterium]|nr:hypothetical protein [Verrucomicrobiota bacterium]
MNQTTGVDLNIVEEHFEEMEFLWGQWRRAKGSSLFTQLDVARIEERIKAHAAALQAYRLYAESYILQRLKSDSAAEVFAAAWWLLTIKAKGAELAMLERLQVESKPTMQRALTEAMGQVSSSGFAAKAFELNSNDLHEIHFLQLRLATEYNPSLIRKYPLTKYLRAADAELRLRAWETARWCPLTVTPEQTLAGALDTDSRVRRVALEIAAWSGQTWVLEHCRRAAVKPTVENLAELEFLAILGNEKDGALLLNLANKVQLGPERYRILGSSGWASGVPCLLQAMSSAKPADAAAAGATFTRITGRTLRVIKTVTIPPEDGSVADDFEKEFLKEVAVPDVKEAQEFWRENADKFGPGLRYSQGLPVPDAPPFSPELDILSIREAALRSAFEGRTGPTAVDFEQFPTEL